MVLPPDKIIFEDNSFKQSGSHFIIEWNVNSCIPGMFLSKWYIKIYWNLIIIKKKFNISLLKKLIENKIE